MTAVFDALTNGYDSDFGPTATVNHTPVGTPRGVAVIVQGDLAPIALSTCTYGGIAMTPVQRVNSSFRTGVGGVAVFFLGSGVPTGAQDAVFTRDSGNSRYNVNVITWTADGDMVVEGSDFIDSDTALEPTSIIGLNGETCLVYLGFIVNHGALPDVSPLTGWSEEQETDMGPAIGGVYSYDTEGSADVTYGLDHLNAQQQVIVGFAVRDTVGGGPDETAPTPDTAPAVDAEGQTSVTVDAAYSDETESTVDHYAVAVADGAGAPSAAQVIAGQDSTGSAAISAGNDLAVANAAEGSITLSGLSAFTAYDIYYVVTDGTNPTTPVLLNATTGPALSLPAAVANATVGATGNDADLDITTQGDDGTMYWYISASATPPSDADLQAGTGSVAFGSAAVTVTGNQSFDGVGSLDEDTTYYAYFQHVTAAGATSAISGPTSLVVPVDLPILSAAIGASTGATTADVQVNTNRTNGTLYVVVTQDVTIPSAAQIIAGQNHLGAAADFAANDATPTATTSFSATGLTDDTGFYAHFYQVDAQGDPSNRINSNSFSTGTTRSISSFSPTVPRPGEVVTVALSGAWNAGSKTANLNGHALTLTGQTASSVTFTMPSLHTNPTYSDSRYGADLPFTLSDAGQDVVRLLNSAPPAGYDYLTIASISSTGIWLDDTNVVAGDFHLGYYVSGSGDPILDGGDLQGIVAPAVYRYWIFDASLGQWSVSADESLFEIVTNDASAIVVPTEHEGVAITAIDPTIGFNTAEADITGYAIQSGTLPAGLSINASTGEITGTPDAATAGAASGIVVRATDSDGNTADSAAFTITIHAAPTWTATPAVTFGDGLVAAYDLNQDLDSTFADATSYSLAAGVLPTGVTLNTATGVLEGTVGQVSGSSPFTGIQIQATNPAGSNTSAAFSIVVNPAAPTLIGSISIPGLTQDTAMTPVDASTAFGGGAASSYALLGTWPTGLSINASGVISGTPTNTGSFTGLQVRATNASGTVTSGAISFTVSADIGAPVWGAIASPTVAESASGSQLALSASVSSGTGPFTYALASGSLPAGWSLSSTTGVVNAPGDRNNEGVFPVTFRVTGPGGSAVSATVTITVTSSDPVVGTPIADQADNIDDAVSWDVRGNFTGVTNWLASGMPPGVSFSGGVFVGQVVTPGIYPVTVTAQNTYGQAQDVFVWTVIAPGEPPVLVNGVPAQNLVQGDAVNIDLADYISGAVTITADLLPTGVSLVGTVISGTVTTVESVLTELTATNPDGVLTPAPTIVWLVETGAPAITSEPPNLTSINGLPTSRDMSIYFDRDVSIALTAGTLPTGLSIDGAGLVTGTPTVNATSAGLQLTATNPYGTAVTASFDWVVRDAVPSKGIVLGLSIGL